MTVAERVYKLWVYGEILCKVTPYLQVVSLTASTLTITTMSLDRCLAIRHPMKFRNFRTTKYVRIVILVIWFVSVFLALPLLIVRVTYSEEIIPGEVITYCTEVWNSITSRQVYDVALLLLMCIIPGITITVSYLLMGRRLWLPDRKLSDDFRYRPRGSRTESERERSLRNITLNRRRLAKLCIVIAIVFIICWTPYFIVNTYVDFSPDLDAVDLSSFILLIGHIHCVTNPILYCFLHKTFRHYVLRCIVSRMKSQQPVGRFGQAYMTFYRTTPFKSHPRSSQKSLTSQTRRRSSTSSSTHGKNENEQNGRLIRCSGDNINDSRKRLIVNIISSPSETLNHNHHNAKKLDIPSAIKEESKLGSASFLNENHNSK